MGVDTYVIIQQKFSIEISTKNLHPEFLSHFQKQWEAAVSEYYGVNKHSSELVPKIYRASELHSSQPYQSIT
jgi:hypothetical protein